MVYVSSDCVTATTNETAKWLASLPISMQNHSGGGSVALFWYRLPLSPTSWDFGPHQYVLAMTWHYTNQGNAKN